MFIEASKWEGTNILQVGCDVGWYVVGRASFTGSQNARQPGPYEPTDLEARFIA
jgi:hypothetical protein